MLRVRDGDATGVRFDMSLSAQVDLADAKADRDERQLQRTVNSTPLSESSASTSQSQSVSVGGVNSWMWTRRFERTDEDAHTSVPARVTARDEAR